MANLRYFSYFIEETQKTIIDWFDADSIKNFYSTHGTYFKGYNNGEIQEYEGKFYADPTDLSKGLKEHFEEKYAAAFEVDEDNHFVFKTNEAKEYFKALLELSYESEGEIVEAGKKVWIIGDRIEECNIEETGVPIWCEGFTEWDGNNWRLIELLSTFGETNYSEVTDEYDWDSLKFINNDSNSSNPSYYSYYVMKDLQNEGYLLVKKYNTCYQSDSPHYEIIYDEEAIVKYFSDEEIAKYFPEIKKQYGENLRVAYKETNQGTDYDKFIIFSRNEVVRDNENEDSNPNDTRGTDHYLLKNGTKLKYHWTRWQGEKSEWTF